MQSVTQIKEKKKKQKPSHMGVCRNDITFLTSIRQMAKAFTGEVIILPFAF
jgi:hypothetical protein